MDILPIDEAPPEAPQQAEPPEPDSSAGVPASDAEVREPGGGHPDIPEVTVAGSPPSSPDRKTAGAVGGGEGSPQRVSSG